MLHFVLCALEAITAWAAGEVEAVVAHREGTGALVAEEAAASGITLAVAHAAAGTPPYHAMIAAVAFHLVWTKRSEREAQR